MMVLVVDKQRRRVLFWLDVKEVGVVPHLQCSAVQHQPIGAQWRWKEAEPEADGSQGEFSVRHSQRINQRGKQLWLALQDWCQTARSLQFSSFSLLIFSSQLFVSPLIFFSLWACFLYRSLASFVVVSFLCGWRESLFSL